VGSALIWLGWRFGGWGAGFGRRERGEREREREMGSVLLRRQFVPMLAGSLLSVGRRKSPSSGVRE
jgi:hypothetical protein